MILVWIYYEIEIINNMEIKMKTNKKDVKTNLVSVRITDAQLAELKNLVKVVYASVKRLQVLFSMCLTNT